MTAHDITIQFAHTAYQFAKLFERRDTGISNFQSWSAEDTRARIGESDVLVVSGLWNNDLLEEAEKLRFVQACGAGYDQFDLDMLGARGVRLANASGVNANAVSDHAMALILALTRQIHSARDNQRSRHWRAMISDLAQREDELPGKTVLIFGLGTIGKRIAKLAKAFGLTVIGIKRDLTAHIDHVDELCPPDALLALLPRSDFAVLACPLTPATRNVIDGAALAAMKQTAYLVNVARGGCVDEAALIDALQRHSIAGAGIDVTAEEPLAATSPLWSLDNVVLTPHTAGETRRYEDNVIDILLDNIDRLARGETRLRNQIV